MDKESALFYVVLLLFAVTGIVTILGLVQKVSIEKKYLNALFSALILELIAAVLYLFSNTDFFGNRPQVDELLVLRTELPPAHIDISSKDLIALLNKHDAEREKLGNIEQEVMALRGTIASQVPPYDDVTLALDAKIRAIVEVQANLDQLLVEQKQYQILEKNFLVRMANLNAKISELGGTINFDWEPEEKHEIAGMLQAAFKQIGFMTADQKPDDDPGKALQLLVAYQESKNFGKTGFLTSQVVALIILDYLSPVSSNGNSSEP